MDKATFGLRIITPSQKQNAFSIRPVLIEERKSPFSIPQKGGLMFTLRGFYRGDICRSDQSVVVFQKEDFDFEKGDFLFSIRTGLNLSLIHI